MNAYQECFKSFHRNRFSWILYGQTIAGRNIAFYMKECESLSFDGGGILKLNKSKFCSKLFVQRNVFILFPILGLFEKKPWKNMTQKRVKIPILLDLIRIERPTSNPWLPLFKKWNLEFKIQYCKSFAEIWFQVLKSVEFCRRPQNEAAPSSELLQCHRGEARDLFHQTSQEMQILSFQCFNSTESSPG